jgi:dipeptidyl aminopeptidase/acylaminoacyl peptidase
VERDIRETELFREATELYKALRQPGTGRVTDAAEVHVAPDGRHAVFSATLVDALEGAPPTRICRVDLASGDTQVLTSGPNTDRLAKYSPDGREIAFLSDRHGAQDFQLYLLDCVSGAVRRAPSVEGWVEYFHWSADGRRILLGAAGHGADLASGQGATTSKRVTEKLPSWMPTVETGNEHYRWRHLWVYELASGQVRRVSSAASNIWEAVWCGSEAVAAVVSPGPDEGLWYSARLRLIEIDTGRDRELYAPQAQLGYPAASPSGKNLAIIEAICSDRGAVAGDLQLIDTASGNIRPVDTHGVDVTHIEWRSDSQVLLAGHRGFETVVGLYDGATGAFAEVWNSQHITTGGRYVAVSACDDSGDCVLIGEGFTRAPEIAVIRNGEYRAVRSFDLEYSSRVAAIGAVDCVSWRAPDGLEIQGWLLRPTGAGPHPTIMNIHGGPVYQWRPHWLGRPRSVPALLWLEHGYAVFFPNPRGSSGRGQAYARHVLGDMGGTDTYDYLSGLDHLVREGIADPNRLGVTGVSYGGYMSSWLITQDSRFAAAVSVSPVTNNISQHLISNIPQFMSLFLGDQYNNPRGNYFRRSPIMHAHQARTPTLNICGLLDRCTPAEEAVQFHNALLQSGVRSVLVIYPEEGHGVRKFPAAIDYAARSLAWFEEHMPATAGG